jgi:hypothetical protein
MPSTISGSLVLFRVGRNKSNHGHQTSPILVRTILIIHPKLYVEIPLPSQLGEEDDS